MKTEPRKEQTPFLRASQGLALAQDGGNTGYPEGHGAEVGQEGVAGQKGRET